MAIKGIFSTKQQILKKLNSVHGNIYTPEEFQALVKYERARSDRSNCVFSIVVFNQENGGRYSFESFLLKVSTVTRSIDCVGWDEQGQVSVLLPDTKKEGAVAFAEKVNGEFETKGDSIHYNVYSYPENWLENEHHAESEQELNKPEAALAKKTIEYLFVKRMPSWKRNLDIYGSLFLLVLTSPILLLLGIYIKLISPGPVFYKQIRIGYKGIPFTFWKFRTMACNNNENFHGSHATNFIKSGEIPMEKLDTKDPRIIPGGRFIRKCCLDELPQFWNVLKGEMSLVGPRPCIPYEAKEYLRWHTHRFDTVPGLSGLWQVSGKNKLTFNQMIRLDIQYCRNMSLIGDLLILLKTPIAIMIMLLEGMAKKMAIKGEADSPRPVLNAHASGAGQKFAKVVTELER